MLIDYVITGMETTEEEYNDVLAESGNDNVTNDENEVANDRVGGDDVKMSEVGMMFNDENDTLDFYKHYAFQVGFPVRKWNSKKGVDGVMRYVTFTCGREGRRSYGSSNSLKQQPTSQTDCRARILAFLLSNGQWRVNTALLEHNHETSPSKSRLYRCNQELTANVK